MNNYLIFIEEMYLRGIISKETYEKSKRKGEKAWWYYYYYYLFFLV